MQFSDFCWIFLWGKNYFQKYIIFVNFQDTVEIDSWMLDSYLYEENLDFRNLVRETPIPLPHRDYDIIDTFDTSTRLFTYLHGIYGGRQCPKNLVCTCFPDFQETRIINKKHILFRGFASFRFFPFEKHFLSTLTALDGTYYQIHSNYTLGIYIAGYRTSRRSQGCLLGCLGTQTFHVRTLIKPLGDRARKIMKSLHVEKNALSISWVLIGLFLTNQIARKWRDF